MYTLISSRWPLPPKRRFFRVFIHKIKVKIIIISLKDSHKILIYTQLLLSFCYSAYLSNRLFESFSSLVFKSLLFIEAIILFLIHFWDPYEIRKLLILKNLLIKKPNVLDIILQIHLFKFLIKYFFLCQTLKFILEKTF